MQTVRVALIQFDARPEAVSDNLDRMQSWVARAGEADARWIMFHEGTLCDYTPELATYAEPVPGGASTQRLMQQARSQDCFISFGLSEADAGRYYISQVFVGPEGLAYRYRKSWLWREPSDQGYRDEWARYDPGSGPELFALDGVRATCFICADGEAHRCVERAGSLGPEVVFYPNNRVALPDHAEFGQIAARIGAPMLATNRTGMSWVHDCRGGCAIYSRNGETLAASNREGRDEMLVYDLEI